MAEESRSASGRRFAGDLRRIREAHGASIEDVHNETKIPVALIESFEETALFDHPQFNRVYLRSFVRTYAQVAQMDTTEALEALEEALSSAYEGRLAARYLGEEAEGTGADEASPEAEATPQEEAEDAPSATGASPDRAPEDEREAVPADGPDESEAGKGEVASAYVSTTRSTASTDEPDWTSQSPPVGVPVAERRQAGTRTRTGGGDGGRWVAVALVVVVAVAVVWIVLRIVHGGGGGPMPTPSADTTRVTDTTAAQAPAPPATPVRSRPVPTLGDTMDVYVVAEKGKLAPVRVTVDSDVRRPYWLERGDSMRFTPTRRIVIEERLDSLRINLEGETYPASRRDSLGRVVITRDAAERFFDALRNPSNQ